MAYIKVLKIGATGSSTEHADASDSIKFQDIHAESSLLVNTDKFTVSSAGAVAHESDLAINTDKFVVTAASGNTAIAGDVAVNTNKFTVAAASGNTLIAGTGDVTGDFKVNTDKFTVAAASGNIVAAGTGSIAGDFAVATDKFTVAAASGNTVIAGTGSVAGDFAVATDKFTVASASGNIVAAGTGSFGGAVNMNSNKITNLASATDAADAVRYDQLQAVQNGMDWKQFVNYCTNMAITAGTTTGANVNAHAETEGTYSFVEGDYILCIADSKIYVLDGSDTWQDVDSTGPVYDDGDRYVTAATGHARYVKIDLPDSPAGQENSAVYAFNGTSYVKIADVDWDAADGIAIASGYSASAGTISSGDSVQKAISNLDGNNIATQSDLDTLEGTTPTSDSITITGDLSGLDLEVKYSTAGASNAAIQASDAASTSPGFGASLIGIHDASTLITATTVEDALVENRTAIDAIEDNTISSANGSISVSGTVGGDDQNVDVVFSTTGAANRSIQASDLASTANGVGASMIGVEDAAANYTATDVEGVLTEIDGRLDTLEAADVTETLQEAYEAGNSITTDSSNGDIQFAGTETLDVNIASDFSGNVDLSSGANLTGSSGSVLSGFDSIEGITSANLVDKSATESISGAWDFDDIDINAEFKIDGSAVSANVTAANLNTLTAGSTSNADALHTHAGSALEMTANGDIASLDAVRINGNDSVSKAQADSLTNAAVIGFAEAAINDTENGNISLPGAVIEGVLSGATAGQKFYLDPSTAGAITSTVPSGSGEVILVVGFAKNATDLFCQIGDPKVRA